MELKTPSQKQYKTIKVRRKIPHPTPSPKTTTYKIAKKIDPCLLSTPLPSSIQSGFLSDLDSNADLFLTHRSFKSHIELISPVPVIKSDNFITPCNIVGPKESFYKRANLFKPQTGQNPRRLTLRLDKNRFTRPRIEGFDERLKVIRDGIQSSSDQEIKDLMKLNPGAKITWMQQTRSLQAWDKQKEDWKRLEEFLADKVQKDPEGLGMNSAKAFRVRKKEIEVIDKVQRMNEDRRESFWYSDLRSGLYTRAQPSLALTLTTEDLNTLSTKPLLQDKVLRSQKDLIKEKSLLNSDYFQSKFKIFSRGSADLKHFCSADLEIKGKDKLKLELDAVKRAGVRACIVKESEQLEESTIMINYSPRTIY